MSLRPGVSASSVTASDIAVAVRNQRAKWREVQDEKAALEAEVKRLEAEFSEAEAQERQLFNALAEARKISNERIRAIAEDSATTSIDLLHALLVMIELRREEDSLTLANLHDEAVRLDEECKSYATLMAMQRNETIRAAKSLAAEYHKTHSGILRDQAEVLRLRHERQDLCARTDVACLRHAKELFSVHH